MKTLISMLIALIAILVSSCNEEVTEESNNDRMERNYPYIKELDGFILLDSAFDRLYRLETYPYAKGSSDYGFTYPLPKESRMRITVTEISRSPKEYVIFEDFLFDGSLDHISTLFLSYEDKKSYESDKDNLPDLLKQNQAKYDCLRKRIAELAVIELKKRHDLSEIKIQKEIEESQNLINKIVPCE